MFFNKPSFKLISSFYLDTVIVIFFYYFYLQSEWEEMHNLFTAGQECGWLQPKIAREYPLSEAAASHRDVIHHRGIMGKLVLDTAT